MQHWKLACIPYAFALLLSPGMAWADTCTGNCGTATAADGVVTAPPGSATSWNWVSTYLGQPGAAKITGYSGSSTNGSELRSSAFAAKVGDKVSFYFNYVTSDGAGFSDYAFAQLLTAGATDDSLAVNLFTARTKPSGTIVPGQSMPAVNAALSPSTVPIIAGGPVWSPLGPSSGSCYDVGCGYTGWIKSEYTITTAGTYQLRFGAANWGDIALDTGMAFTGVFVNGTQTGSSPSNPFMPSAPQNPVTKAFSFDFVATPATPIFIDPDYATGYIYNVLSGPNIASAIFPTIAGDLDGYDVYSLNDVLLAHGVYSLDFTTFLAGGVNGFKLKGIDLGAALDPTDGTAFVTGLTFISGGAVSMTQTPIITTTGVPEPSTWASMLLGMGLVGHGLRRRRRRRQAQLAQLAR